jgi:endonuclease YncB( thermonuclease family)
MNRDIVRLAVACWLGASASVAAASIPQDVIVIHPGVTLVSGDTWLEDGKRYRLFGVQSCLRGTWFTNATGQRLDCGDASMAFLAAFIKDTNPRCTPLVITSELAYVVCSAAIGNQTVDLGTALVGSGYAFAALDNRGLPANPAYAVAEQRARAARAGLWQFADVQHPALILGPAESQRKAQK